MKKNINLLWIGMLTTLLIITNSSCEMNRICHYMESINFNIKKKLKRTKDTQNSSILQGVFEPKNDLNYKKVLDIVLI